MLQLTGGVYYTPRGAVLPLYLAGFTTAFGAHGVATALALEAGDLGLSLLSFGAVLALYDVAEVILKPIFGALSDRIGVKPVVLAGLIAFALASSVAIVSPTPLVAAAARFGQGAAAAAFSPASSSAVARLAGKERLGHFFGRYGAWKSIGYAAGPLLGAALVSFGGLGALYLTLALLATATAFWVAVAVPPLPVLPRPRYTLADLIRQTRDRSFLIPTLALASTTALLGVAVGYLPSCFTARASPRRERRRRGSDRNHLGGRPARRGSAPRPRKDQRSRRSVGCPRHGRRGLGADDLPQPIALYAAALLIGVAVGVATPLAYSHLAATTPAERLGRTMGNAELGREVGDAGGPLLVGIIGTLAGLPLALGTLALLIATAGAATARSLRPDPPSHSLADS
ncbi:MFS transporter [Leifsonia sp. L25]|uniref:MFS transporter n=1 Tax=Leifsonia sp. L25 TaxID=3423957 RepID=UPI003D697644